MVRYRHFPKGITLLLLFLVYPAVADLSRVEERIRYRLEVLHTPGELVAAGDVLYTTPLLREFYTGRGFAPVWIDKNGPLPALDGLIETVRQADREGLPPEHYHLAALESVLRMLDATPSAQREARILADLELLATDAFLTLANHFTHGMVDPTSVDSGWFLDRSRADLLAPLKRVEARNAGSASNELTRMLPSQPGYQALRDRLALQRSLLEEGDWAPIPAGPVMRPGTADQRVSLLRSRLAQLLDIVPSADEGSDPNQYDMALADAMVRFQRRHGLEPDAVVGPRTLAALNITPRERIEQLRANLERWRWLPADLGREHIVVNIAGFYMDVVVDQKSIMRQDVVVGRPFRRTPVFTGRMTYLVLNPSWEVPPRLAAQDQLPLIRQNPDYLQEMGFSVLRGWGVEEQRIDPATIDWNALSARSFPYRLRQNPGPRNALGQVKFMFPNHHNVYLHDTPARGLFARADRAASSGCIRLSEPLQLAEWLLSGEGRPSVMTPERIHQIVAQGNETTVRLSRAMPVHLLYWTAWVENDGLVYYVDDVYARDQALIAALNETPPISQ